MSQQLVVAVAICATAALRADVCGGLRAGPPVGSNYLDTPQPRAFRITVKPGGPAFRITIRPLLLKWQTGSTDTVHAGDIEVALCQDGRRVQVLPILAWQPIDFAATFAAEDINFDGYLDISVLTEFAAKFGSRSYWVYDSSSGLFVTNELTKQLGENCLGAQWHGGCWKANFIDFDRRKREISAHYLWGVGQCGSPTDRYRVEKDRLIVVHKEILDANPDGCTLSASDLTPNGMWITRVQRFDSHGTPVK